MIRLSILFLVVFAATVAFACGSASTPTASPENAASPESAAPDGEVCAVVDPGPPAVCPEGCVWNGSECRKHSGIIMPNSRDGGAPH